MINVTKYKVALVRETTKRYGVDKTIDSSSKAQDFLKDVTCYYEWHNEKFGMICLDNQNNVVGYHIIFEGSLSETPVYPREVATRALLNNASSVILFHNHPGNSLTPSQADIQATRNIKSALEVLQIKVVDHLILTDDSVVSMAERGLV
jgi:DNA repair protein RadC